MYNFLKIVIFILDVVQNLTVPLIRPKASATLQTFKEPIVILEGLSKPNSLFRGFKDY